MYLPATFEIGQVRNLCCPCDDEFWCAQTAGHWKTLPGDNNCLTIKDVLFGNGTICSVVCAHAGGFQLDFKVITTIDFVTSFELGCLERILVLAALQVQIFNFSPERLLLDLSSFKRTLRSWTPKAIRGRRQDMKIVLRSVIIGNFGRRELIRYVINVTSFHCHSLR